jgi:hypothetical protein
MQPKACPKFGHSAYPLAPRQITRDAQQRARSCSVRFASPVRCSCLCHRPRLAAFLRNHYAAFRIMLHATGELSKDHEGLLCRCNQHEAPLSRGRPVKWEANATNSRSGTPSTFENHPRAGSRCARAVLAPGLVGLSARSGDHLLLHGDRLSVVPQCGPRHYRDVLFAGNNGRRASAGTRSLGIHRRHQHAGVQLLFCTTGVQLSRGRCAICLCIGRDVDRRLSCSQPHDQHSSPSRYRERSRRAHRGAVCDEQRTRDRIQCRGHGGCCGPAHPRGIP